MTGSGDTSLTACRNVISCLRSAGCLGELLAQPVWNVNDVGDGPCDEFHE